MKTEIVRPRMPAAVGLLLALALLLPFGLAGQDPQLAGSFRPYRFVLLAFAASWLLIAAWVFVIGRKLNRLAERMEEESPGA